MEWVSHREHLVIFGYILFYWLFELACFVVRGFLITGYHGSKAVGDSVESFLKSL